MAGEREERANLCARLRDPHKVSMIDCSQAANEIEDLEDRVGRHDKFLRKLLVQIPLDLPDTREAIKEMIR